MKKKKKLRRRKVDIKLLSFCVYQTLSKMKT